MANESHGSFEDVLAAAEGSLAEMCTTLRKIIVGLHKAHVEICWPKQKIASYGVGPKKMTEHYAYIAVFKAHLNLGFYYGAGLPDPKGMLEGTGKNLRHVKLRDLATCKSPAIKALVKAAIADRKATCN